MSRPRILTLLGLVLVLTLAAGLLTSRDPTRDGPKDLYGQASEAGDPATLVGAGRSSEEAGASGDPAPRRIDALARRARGPAGDDAHEAVRALQKLHARGEVPLELLVTWALLPAAEGGAGRELAAWARSALASGKPASLTILPTILEAALGASEAEQEAVAATLRSLGEVRREDVPQIARVFAHGASGYGVKRALIGGMDDLGRDAVPLAPHLMTFITTVLKDRAVAAQEAEEAGIHVSFDLVEYEVERILGAMGPSVVAQLERGLRKAAVGRDPENYFASDASGIYASALAAAGDDGRLVLMKMLSDPDRLLRQDAASALGEVKGGHPAVRDALLAALQSDDDDIVRRTAATALGRHERVVISALLDALADESSDVRRAAAGSLAKLEVEPADALPRLIAMVESDGRFAALTAAESIASFGEAARPALPTLIKALDTDDAWFQARFSAVVAQVAKGEPEALAQAYEGSTVRVQRGILATLLHLSPRDPSVEGLLVSAHESEDLEVRVRAAALLAGESRADVMPALEAGFASDDGQVRLLATEALARVGPRAFHLLPIVLERLQDGGNLCHDPVSAHGGEEAALDAAVQALGPYDLGRMFDLLGHESFNLSYAAQESFRSAGRDAFVLFEDRWSTADAVRKTEMLSVAGWALQLKEEGREDREELQDASRKLARRGLVDVDPGIRLEAVLCLARDPDPGGLSLALPVLVGLLDEPADDHIETVRSAAYQLQHLGPKAAPIEVELGAHRDHADPQVRRYVRRALEKIDDARDSGSE